MVKKNVFAIIQARLGSNRLPNKILLKLLPGKTSLECMLERVKRAKIINNVIIATTNNPKDKKLIKYLGKINQKYFVGDENDVLDRYYQTAKKYCASKNDVVVRLTADCPVIDPAIIDKVVWQYLNNDFDFVSNTLQPYTYPDGMDVEVFSFGNLKKASEEAKLPSHREHVTFYFWQNPEIFKIYHYKSERNLSEYRLTLDYIEDYELLKIIYKYLYKKNKKFTLEDIIDFLDKNPKIKNINAQIKKNTGWQGASTKDKKFLKKLNNK